MKHFFIFLFVLILVQSLFTLTLCAQLKPGAASPISDVTMPTIFKSDVSKQSLLAKLNSVASVSTSTLAGGNRLVATQNTDGGWGWPLTGTSAQNTVGPIAMGLAQAYQQTGSSTQRTALSTAGTFLLAKINTFSPSDGYLAAQLDKIFGVTIYTEHVKTNFYDKLAAGTYDRSGLGVLYTTASYIDRIRTARSGDQANMAAWDIGIGLVGAASCGALTADWIAGVKAEIDELDGSNYYDVIGLAGAVYGLAFVNEDYDPAAGQHVAANNINDLANILLSYQISGGGFTWNSGYVSSGNETNQETGYAILALNEINRSTYLASIQGAADYLMTVQLGTGGWDDYVGDTGGENNEITGEALWGISSAYPPPVHNITKDVYYPTVQGAADDASAGNVIQVAAGTYSVPSLVTLNKANLTLQGVGSSSTILQVSGTGDRFSISASGVTIQDLEIEKTDKVGLQNIIGIYASNTTIKNTIIHGQFVITPTSIDGDVSRAMVVSGGLTGVQIEGNTFYGLRQPGYFSGPTTGNIVNNYTYGTKGWVMEGGDMTFTGNTWGSGAQTNVYDIAILSLAPPTAYLDIVTMSNANNGAVIEDQRVVPAVLSVVYVNASVAYTTDLGGQYHPYTTIAPAITRVVPRGKILVTAGTYPGNNVINKSLTLLGDPGDANPGPGTNAPIVDGGGLNIDAFKISNGVTNVTMQGFVIQNFSSPSYNTVGSGIQAWVGSTSNITIRDNSFLNLGYNGILVGNDKNSDPSKWGDHTYWTVKNNIVSNCGYIGFELTNTSNSSIEDNVIHLATPFIGAIFSSARRSEAGLTVKNNLIDGTPSTGYPVIYMYAYDQDMPSPNLNNVLIESNNIATVGTPAQIYIRNIGTGTVTGVTVIKNTLASLRSNTPAVVTAINNYWGSPNGPVNEKNVFNMGSQGGTVSIATGGTMPTFCPWWKDISGVPGTYTGTSFAPITNNDVPVENYSNFSDAITGTTASGIISTVAGTYTEGSPQLIINKNISIVGEDKITTIIRPAQNTGSSGDARGWFLVNSGMTFNLSDVTLDGAGKNIFMAILSHGTGTIDNNIIKNIRYSQYLGMGIMMYGGNFVISNNILTNIERIGMYCNGTGVTNGQFIGNTYTGKGDGDWLDYGIEIEKGAVATATGNTITNCTGVAVSDGSTSAGMYLTTYFAPGTTGTFTNNIVTNNYVGLEVGYDASDASIAVAHNNVFSGNTGYGILSTNPFVDATNNYWGSLFGPLDAAGTVEVPKSPKPAISDMQNTLPASALGNVVSENVDYYPWLGNASSIASGGGLWVGGYVNPTANSIFAGLDVAALDGVDPMDAVAPPPPPSDYLYMYFLLAPGQPISNYSTDIKKDEASLASIAKNWDLRVITDHTSSLVTLEFPLAGLPSGFKPVLYDLSTGDFQNLREFPYYTYTSPASEITSNFKLLIGDSTKPAITLTSPDGGEFWVVGTPYTITWSSSDASGLLAHDVYYSLTGSAPYTLIGSVNGSVHSISWTPTVASSMASIKVVARDSVMNEESDISDYTFQILATNSIAYNAVAGWNLVSPAMQQVDMTPAGVFSDDYSIPYYTFQYNPSGGYSVPSALNMGQGYWLGSNSSATVDAEGTPLTTANRLLLNGFNIIGNPYSVAILKDNLRFTDGGTTKTMAEAATAGWLSNVLYGYNGSGYEFENITLGVWKGYWIPMMTDGITIQYHTTVGIPTPKITPAVVEATATHWSLDLEAALVSQNGEYIDRIASFGVHEEATDGFDPMFDAPRPPRSPSNEFIEVSFQIDARNYPMLTGSNYARDYKNSNNPMWEFMVVNSKEGTINLQWDNEVISKLTSDIKIELYDVSANRIIDMKKVNSYSYEQIGTNRKFTINKIDRVIPIAFELLQNYPNPFNPTTTITYALPFNANVSVQVYDFVGRKVAILIEENQEAGYHDVKFDASQISSGLYFYHMVAIGENGKQFSDSKKMMLLK